MPKKRRHIFIGQLFVPHEGQRLIKQSIGEINDLRFLDDLSGDLLECGM
jgi:hypothetical protein